MFSFKFYGDQAALSALKDELAIRLENAVAQTGQEMAVSVRAALSVPAETAGGKVQAAPVGEPPHRRTGNLRASIGCTVSAAENETTAAVGDLAGSAPYAAALEYGTETMRPRPFLLPALLASAAKLAARVKTLARGRNQ